MSLWEMAQAQIKNAAIDNGLDFLRQRRGSLLWS